MAFEQKPLSGSLFRNSNKESDTDRDYSGSIRLDDGREFWVNGYVRTPKSGGNKYLALSLKAKGDRTESKKPRVDDFQDSIPF